jgi:FKBP-type peptidyl-prolyl cis-trans isomerase
VLTPGTGSVHPVLDDSVKVTFASWTTDGTPFLAGDAITFHVARAIPGWSEALAQMVVGEKRRLWVPPALAYEGQLGAPRGLVVFDLQLVEIVPGPSAPADVGAPPPGAMKLQDGLASQVLAPGDGKVHPAINDIVTLTFASWTADGTPLARGEGVAVTVGRSIPGWVEAIPLMVVGEKRRIWLPPALAYAAVPGTPSGPVVFDLELSEITPGPVAPSYVWAPASDAKTTKDGLSSKLFAAGSGRVHPRMNDAVRVHFTAWDRDGRLRDASGETPVVRPLAKDFPGWAEGLEQMVVGEARVLWIPASLQPKFDPGAPPPSDLTFLVELLEILPAPKAPPDAKAPPRSALFERNGVASKVVVKGTGTEHPRVDSTVEVAYSTWTSDGKFVSASSLVGKPPTLRLEDDLPPWAVALERMVEGETRRVWIPKRLAFKDQGTAAKGLFVVDITLRKVESDPGARL